MATAKKKGKGAKVSTYVAMNVTDETYRVFHDSTLAEVEEQLDCKQSSVIGKAPDFQVIEVPKRITNLYKT